MGGIVLGIVLATTLPAVAETPSLRVLGLQPPKEEVEAPDFTLPDVNGKKIRLRDLRGKVIFLNFFATWCEPCRMEMPAMERLSSAYKDKGLVVLAVDVGEGAKAVRAFLKELKVSFLAVLDEDWMVSYKYGIRPIPATFLVDRNGKIAWRAFGSREWDSPESREYFARLVDGRKN